MLLLPLVLGLLGVKTWTPASVVIPPAAVLLFLARFAVVPGGTRVRAGGVVPWAAVYLLASAVGLVLAVGWTSEPARPAALELAGLVGVLGSGNAALVVAGRGRSVLAEAAAMGSAALLAPLEMVVGGRPPGGDAIATGLLCFGYFLSSLVTVRTFRAGRTRMNVVAHAGLAGGLLVAWAAGGLRPALLLAFAPVVARAGFAVLRPPRNLRALGLRELWVSGALLVAAGVVLR